MKLIKAIIRPNKLEEVKDALTKLGISGMTVTEVRGHGRQKGHKAIYRGTEYSVTLLPKIMVELVLPDQMVDDAIKTVIETARTGEIGDGRVFIFPVEQGYNIRTGEKEITQELNFGDRPLITLIKGLSPKSNSFPIPLPGPAEAALPIHLAAFPRLE